MARYGGDFGRYFQGMEGFGAGWGRGNGGDYGYGHAAEDFRGGFYRGGGQPSRRAAYRAYPGSASEFGYGREYGPRSDEVGAPRAGYDTGFCSIRRGWVGERGRYGGARQMRAAEIMTENPAAVTPDTPLVDVAKKMKELNVGIIPVVDDEQSRHLQGVITDRDIAIRAVAEGKGDTAKVSDCMTRDVESCRRDDRVQDLLDVMRSEQVRRVPITDDEGRLVGIVAQADLAVEYAGLDREREIAVEEAVERISELARPRRGRGERAQQP